MAANDKHEEAVLRLLPDVRDALRALRAEGGEVTSRAVQERVKGRRSVVLDALTRVQVEENELRRQVPRCFSDIFVDAMEAEFNRHAAAQQREIELEKTEMMARYAEAIETAREHEEQIAQAEKDLEVARTELEAAEQRNEEIVKECRLLESRQEAEKQVWEQQKGDFQAQQERIVRESATFQEQLHQLGRENRELRNVLDAAIDRERKLQEQRDDLLAREGAARSEATLLREDKENLLKQLATVRDQLSAWEERAYKAEAKIPSRGNGTVAKPGGASMATT